MTFQGLLKFCDALSFSSIKSVNLTRLGLSVLNITIYYMSANVFFKYTIGLNVENSTYPAVITMLNNTTVCIKVRPRVL